MITIDKLKKNFGEKIAVDIEHYEINQGDMLLAVNGQAVTTTYDVSAAKDGLKVGDTVTLTIYRDGKTFDVDVKLVDTNDIS